MEVCDSINKVAFGASRFNDSGWNRLILNNKLEGVGAIVDESGCSISTVRTLATPPQLVSKITALTDWSIWRCAVDEGVAR